MQQPPTPFQPDPRWNLPQQPTHSPPQQPYPQPGQYRPQVPPPYQQRGYPPPMMPPPKRKGLPWWVILIIVILVMGGIGGIIDATTPKNANTDSTHPTIQPTDPPTPTPLPAHTHLLGNYIDIGNWTLGVGDAYRDKGQQSAYLEDGYHTWNAKPGHIFLIIHLSMQNRAQKSQAVRDDMWRLQSKAGQVFTSFTHVSYIAATTVFPGKNLESELIYEVPQEMKAFRMQFVGQGTPETWEFTVQ